MRTTIDTNSINHPFDNYLGRENYQRENLTSKTIITKP